MHRPRQRLASLQAPYTTTNKSIWRAKKSRCALDRFGSTHFSRSLLLGFEYLYLLKADYEKLPPGSVEADAGRAARRSGGVRGGDAAQCGATVDGAWQIGR